MKSEVGVAPEMFGPYRLDSLLGRGGMGEVYRAYDTEQGRPVALKILPHGLTSDPEYRQRFRREARVASNLTDPHVVPIHRHGEIEGRLFLDMRLVDGDDLAQLLRRDGPLAPEAAVRVIEQIGSALDAAHSAGLVHRDVKPSNVFLTRPVRPGGARFAYLGDFGIARTSSTTSSIRTETGTTLGTLDYMAPERFLGRDVDARADVYALACLLHECLTGRKPFAGDDLPALMHAHMNVAPPHPSVAGSVSPSFDAVITRGMAKSPAERHPSAGELSAHARAALTSTVPPPSAWANTTVGPAPATATSAVPGPTAAAPITVLRNEAPVTRLSGDRPSPARAPAVASPRANTYADAAAIAAVTMATLLTVVTNLDYYFPFAVVAPSIVAAALAAGGLRHFASAERRPIWTALGASTAALTVSEVLGYTGAEYLVIGLVAAAGVGTSLVLLAVCRFGSLGPAKRRRLSDVSDVAMAVISTLILLVVTVIDVFRYSDYVPMGILPAVVAVALVAVVVPIRAASRPRGGGVAGAVIGAAAVGAALYAVLIIGAGA